MDEPIFYSENFVDEEAAVAVTSGDATKGRLNDTDKEAIWQSVGQDDDLDPAVIIIEFKSSGNAIERYIKTIALFNINAKEITIEKWTGSAWSSIYSTSSFAANYLIQDFTEFNTEKIRITFEATQTANQEKYCGEIYILNKLYEPAQGFSQLEIKLEPVAATNRNVDDGLNIHTSKWAGEKVARYTANIRFELLPKAALQSLIDVFEYGVFTIYPEPVEYPDIFYGVTIIPGSMNYGYVSTYKGAGYNLSFTIQEK